MTYEPLQLESHDDFKRKLAHPSELQPVATEEVIQPVQSQEFSHVSKTPKAFLCYTLKPNTANAVNAVQAAQQANFNQHEMRTADSIAQHNGE